MDAWAESSAATVAVVVAIVFWTGCEDGCEGGDALVMVWVENVRVRKAFLVVVKAPGVDKDYGVFGEVVAIDPVCESLQVRT